MHSQNYDAAKKVVYRTMARAALVWGVDRNNARQNPVFWHDGSLNYCILLSEFEYVYAFLKTRGIMSEGFNRANRLNFTFEQLDQALDDDFNRGIDFEEIINLMFDQLWGFWGIIRLNHIAGPYVPKEIEGHSGDIIEFFNSFSELGYVSKSTNHSGNFEYHWTDSGKNLVKKHLGDDVEVSRGG